MGSSSPPKLTVNSHSHLAAAGVLFVTGSLAVTGALITACHLLLGYLLTATLPCSRHCFQCPGFSKYPSADCLTSNLSWTLSLVLHPDWWFSVSANLSAPYTVILSLDALILNLVYLVCKTIGEFKVQDEFSFRSILLKWVCFWHQEEDLWLGVAGPGRGLQIWKWLNLNLNKD